jgi:hypothetical protein
MIGRVFAVSSRLPQLHRQPGLRFVFITFIWLNFPWLEFASAQSTLGAVNETALEFARNRDGKKIQTLEPLAE